MRLTTFAAPSRFHALAGALVPVLWIAAVLLGAAGLALGLLHAPADAQQGDAYRILFVHVPVAWMSMLIYVAMAAWAAVGWIFRVRMAAMLARALAPTGAVCALLALVTGAFWGKPSWGTWWVWDARLTSELILLLLYGGYLALVGAIDDPRRADRAGALVAVVGAVNVPIIYFSVRWWNTLHQGATIGLTSAPKMAGSMLLALALTTLALWAWTLAVVLVRARALVLEREHDAAWVRGRETTSTRAHGAEPVEPEAVDESPATVPLAVQAELSFATGPAPPGPPANPATAPVATAAPARERRLAA
jgi:heme exporter protein C